MAFSLSAATEHLYSVKFVLLIQLSSIFQGFSVKFLIGGSGISTENIT